MFQPDDPLAPPKPAFDEPWQAQVLALADNMVRAGHFSATDWAEALGAALREAEIGGAPDNLETYYTAALTALERLSEDHAAISSVDRRQRRVEWEDAYRRTPHGKPVVHRD